MLKVWIPRTSVVTFMADEHDIPLNKRDVQRAFDALRADIDAEGRNPGSYRSERCVRCYECMFTTGSTDCFKCTYCTACAQCSDCTHCARCDNCHNTSYSVDSSNCANCSYVLKSRNCYGCVFCFGCEGLVNKEFHILNQRFPRKVYFELVGQLKQAFGIA